MKYTRALAMKTDVAAVSAGLVSDVQNRKLAKQPPAVSYSFINIPVRFTTLMSFPL